MIRKFTAVGIVSLLCLSLVAPMLVVTSTPATANHDGDDGVGSFVAKQDDQCVPLEAIGDGETNVSEFYDYRGNGSDYSSHGTDHLQRSQVSQLFLYHGTDGVSLVFLHDSREDDGEGGAVSMTVSGLPQEREWVVQDDLYGNATDDQWDHGSTRSEIDWMWSSGRTDGGAVRGLGALGDDPIVVDAAFGEESQAYTDGWPWATNETDWRVRHGPGEDDLVALDEAESLAIERGSCEPSAPVAALTASPSSVTTDESVTLDASRSYDEGSIVAYHWDVDGNGTVDETTDAPTLTHTYAAPGSYNATVTVEDDDGNENATAVTVEVSNAAPTAAVTGPDAVSTDENATFDASDSSDDDGIAEYRWDVGGDGTVDATTTTPTFTRQFPSPGDREVAVTVVDTHGATDTAAASVTVTDDTPPVARATATPANPTVGEQVTFDGNESSDAEGITAYEWSFGDGATAAGATVTHTYDSPGTYTANLTVRDAGGNANWTTTTVTVAATEEEGDESGGDGGSDPDGGDADDGDDDNTNHDSGGSSAGSTGGGGGAIAPPSTGPESSATAERTADGAVRVAVEDAQAGVSTSTRVPGDGSDGPSLRAVAVTPSADADRLTVTVDRDSDVATPDGTDAALVETTVRDASRVDRLTYQFVLDRPADDRQPLFLRENGSAWTTVDHTVVENGSRMRVNVTVETFDPLVLATARPDVSAQPLSMPDRTTVDEQVAVDVTLSNDGRVSATRSVPLSVDDAVVESRTVTVPARDSITVTYNLTFDAAGDRRVSAAGSSDSIRVLEPEARVRLTDVGISSDRVAPGEPIAIRATFENLGATAATTEATLTLAGETVDAERVAVDPGGTTTVTFNQTLDASGTYELGVNDERRTVTVDGATDSTRPSPAPEASAGGTDTTLVVAGFGALVAVAAALTRLV